MADYFWFSDAQWERIAPLLPGGTRGKERRALEGELAALEAEWKAAEEIAAIADTLTLPEWMAERVARLARG